VQSASSKSQHASRRLPTINTTYKIRICEMPHRGTMLD
jgi:hypothetical protein